MLEYEWGNPSAIMLTGEEPDQHHGGDPTRQTLLDHYASSQPAFNDNSHHFLANPHHHHLHHDLNSNNNSPAFAHHHFNPTPTHHHTHSQQLHHHHSLYDPRSYPGASSFAPPPQSILSLDRPSVGVGSGAQFMLVPKSEESSAAATGGLCRPAAVDLIGSSRIGLNLGGRTYFSSSEDDFMSRLYRRPRPLDGHPGAGSAAANSPRCQAEGCNADLSHAKHYHRRHKVCEFHSKASTVIAAGLTQRFCQQCSRFHLLSEFDNGKRSCRKRLADHNRRRRKTQQQPSQENPKSSSSSSQPENSRTNMIPSSDHNLSRSPPDSAAQPSSSVTVAVSPPRMSLDCFRQRSTYQTTASSGSSSSLFFSSG